MRRIFGVLAVTMALPASAAEALTLDEAVRQALLQSPSVQSTARDVEASEGGVVTANGGFDPVLAVDGGWNRSLSRQRFGQFPDPFFINNDGWDAGLTLSGEAPTGTSAHIIASKRASATDTETQRGTP